MRALACFSRRACVASLALGLVACADPASVVPPPAITPTVNPAPTPPTSPCASDADCRLETVDGCGCIAALESSPPGPGCSHPCFADPCMGRTATCNPSTSTCEVRPLPIDHPPPS